MPQFRTVVDIPPPPWKSDYHKKHLLMGSCFTENIGSRMEELKFNTDVNPFGIIFNPASIASSLRLLISGKLLDKNELFRHAGLWHSYSHHGSFSADSPATALKGMNNRMEASFGYLKEADFLVLTLGTAWVYELKETGRIVANCHKVPPVNFLRYKLSVSEIVNDLRDTFGELWDFNPGIRIILTVSPIRHLSDGAIENQRSKATLLLAADALTRGFGSDKCCYFPSYELIMDELRDYRFYAEDMVHLTQVATGFIWEKFSDWLIDKKSLAVSREVASLVRDMKHRPVHIKSAEYKDFLQKSLQKCGDMAKSCPWLDFSTEIEYFSTQLNYQ